MPQGKGTYGSKVGRPPKKRTTTANRSPSRTPPRTPSPPRPPSNPPRLSPLTPAERRERANRAKTRYTKHYKAWIKNASSIMAKAKSKKANDACAKKVKSRYKVWPSAYASGAVAKCRKVGAKNWGNKSGRKKK